MADMAAFAHSGDDNATGHPGQDIQGPAKGPAQTVGQGGQGLGFDSQYTFRRNDIRLRGDILYIRV
jgi:hypothetical protein